MAGRPRIHRSSADRQAEYQLKKRRREIECDAEMEAVDDLLWVAVQRNLVVSSHDRVHRLRMLKEIIEQMP